MPVKRFHGVGPVTAAKMERLGIHTGADLAAWSLPELEAHFGSSGGWYWRIARGIDERPVRPDRAHKSVSAERTFDSDLSDPDALAARARRASPGWRGRGSSAVGARGRTVTLKVKFADFTLITRSQQLRRAGRRRWPTFAAAGQALLAALHSGAARDPTARVWAFTRSSSPTIDGPMQLGLAI